MVHTEQQTDDTDFECFESYEYGLRATLTRNIGQERITVRFIDIDSGGEVAKMFFTDYFEASKAAKSFVLGIKPTILARIEETRREVAKMATMCKIF